MTHPLSALQRQAAKSRREQAKARVRKRAGKPLQGKDGKARPAPERLPRKRCHITTQKSIFNRMKDTLSPRKRASLAKPCLHTPERTGIQGHTASLHNPHAAMQPRLTATAERQSASRRKDVSAHSHPPAWQQTQSRLKGAKDALHLFILQQTALIRHPNSAKSFFKTNYQLRLRDKKILITFALLLIMRRYARLAQACSRAACPCKKQSQSR